jgi:hypothetical protein
MNPSTPAPVDPPLEEPITYSFGYLIAISLFWISLNACLLVATFLKETPTFWTNAGGYSIAVRDTVLFFYYPLLVLFLLFQVGTTVLFASLCLHHPRRFGIFGLAAMTPAWFLTLVSLALLMANNVANFLHGRPLHWH